MANSRLTITLLFSLLTAPLALGASGSLAGCGGSDTTGGGGTSSSTGTGTNCGLKSNGCFDYTCFKGDAPAVTFKADVLPIFRNSCGLALSCHGSEAGGDMLHYLGPKNSDPEPTAEQIAKIFEQSVGVPSSWEPDMKVVAPGDPQHSFLMYKLDGIKCGTLTCAATDACGTLMPQGVTEDMPFDADKRDIIRRWIAQGAKND